MHPFATRSSGASSMDLVRLACVKHAASVHPEPGSNSPSLTLAFRLHISVVKVPAEQVRRGEQVHPFAFFPPSLARTNSARLLKRSAILSAVVSPVNPGRSRVFKLVCDI